MQDSSTRATPSMMAVQCRRVTRLRALAGTSVIVIAIACPPAAQAWGFEAHQFIMDRAIALLPDGLRPLFERHRAVAVERAIDPDTWIAIGGFDEESPRHFLNLDAGKYGLYPFNGLPRDYEAAVKKFGAAYVRRNGTLPWRAQEFHQRLREALAPARLRRPAGELEAVRLAAALSHYLADAHVPFHAVTNYDGQQTGQRGIHARFETTLFSRFRSELRVRPARRAPLGNVRDVVFDALLEGTRLAPGVLRADRAAAGKSRAYDDAYYEAFFRQVRSTLEGRLSEAIVVVAAAIAGAAAE